MAAIPALLSLGAPDIPHPTARCLSVAAPYIEECRHERCAAAGADQDRAERTVYRLRGIPLTERYIETSASGDSLTWEPVGVAKEEQPANAASYALCRCGQSQDKPYCDGTHTQIAFDGALTADRAPGAARQRILTGPDIEMTDDESLCVHAKFCMTRLSNAWRMVRKTGDPEVQAPLATIVANCPSGRLALRTREGGTPIEPQYHPSIAAIPDGPLWVRGGIPIGAPDGSAYEVRNRATLCRCSQSGNKPFCDGSHVAAGFRAPRQGTAE